MTIINTNTDSDRTPKHVLELLINVSDGDLIYEQYKLEKPEALTTLRRNEIFYVNIRIPKHLLGQSESARGGQPVSN
jgi:hypothetical protein